MFRKVLYIIVFISSYTMGMEFHFPAEIVQWLIIPKESYDAVDNFYKSVRNRYIDHYFHDRYSKIIPLLDKFDQRTDIGQIRYEEAELKKLLEEVNFDDVINWDIEYRTMRNIHLIEISHYAYALEQLNKLPIKAYKESYLDRYNKFLLYQQNNDRSRIN